MRTRSVRLILRRGALKVAFSAPVQRVIATAFSWLYYSRPRRTWQNTYWMGVGIQKCPLDLWVYQEIVFETSPDLIIETGTLNGGSALYLAHLCDLVGKGRVITIDIDDREDRPEHPRITYLAGSSTDPAIIREVERQASGVVLVILDSDHSRDHVLAEMRAYAPLVTVGSYLIVEDTNVNGHPAGRAHGPGPMEAVDAFLAQSRGFSSDRDREKFYLTFNPRGFLRRVE